MLRHATLAFAIAALAILLGSSRLSADVVAIRGGTIIPSPGKVIENGVIVIRDGRIESVGAGVAIPAGAEIIDAEGLTIYAGFIDASTSVGLGEITRPEGQAVGRRVDTRRSAAAHTEETYRKGTSPEILAADFLELDVKGAEGHWKSGFTAALLSPPSDVLAGQSAFVSLSGAPRREAIIASPVAMHGSFSSRGRGYPATLMGCMAHFRQVFLDAKRHRDLERLHNDHPAASNRPPYDPSLTALRPVIDRNMPMVLRASSELGIRRAMRMADEFSFDVILDGGREAWKIAPVLAKSAVPVLVSLGFDKEPKLEEESKDGQKDDTAKDDTAKQPKSWAEQDHKKRFAAPKRVQLANHHKWEQTVKNASVLAQERVKFVFGTQGKAKDFLGELRLAIEHGLSEEEALRALTTRPAALFGVDGSLGTIAAGKAAHLTLMNGTLSTDKASVAFVFVDGEKFEVAGKKKASKEAESTDAEPSGPATLPGTWTVTVVSERGENEMTWKIQQDGRKYSGTLTSRFGDMEMTSATLSDNDVNLTFVSDFDGNEFELKFSGKITGDTAKGSMETPMGEAEWSAERTAKPKGAAR